MTQDSEIRQTQVTLLLPGYTSSSGDDTVVPPHPCHAFFRMTHDAAQEPWQSQLAALIGVDTAAGKRLPSARLGCHKQVPEHEVCGLDREAGLVRADPVSLKADRDTAKLVPAQVLALSEAEADELLDALNNFVAEDGLHFFRHGVTEWYMSGMQADTLESYPPSFLADRNASAFLPEGEFAAPWRRLLTEIQMLLHMQPVNELREQNALMPVNSLWFWGGAPLPQANDVNPNILVFADNIEAQALSRYMGVEVQPVSTFSVNSERLSDIEHSVILDDSLISAWLSADADKLGKNLARINEQWLLPLTQQIETGQVRRINILTEDGLHGICDAQSIGTLTPVQNNRWWMRLWAGFKR